MALTRFFHDDFFEPRFLNWPAFPALAANTALGAWRPSCDVHETDQAYVISAAVPGAKKEDVSVELEGNVLRLSGTVRQETKNESDKHHRIERSYGEFVRAFTLPSNADLQAIKAEHKDGVLTVTVAKVAPTDGSASKRIDVN